MANANKILEVSKEVLKYTNPLAYALAEVLENAIGKSASVIAQDDVEKMTGEATRQEIRTKIAIDQVKIFQELAIAKRIEIADEVEIEEYYDNNIEGNLGLKGDEKGISLGANGSSKRDVKRVYKFKGYNEVRADIYEQTLSNLGGIISTEHLANDTDKQ